MRALLIAVLASACWRAVPRPAPIPPPSYDDLAMQRYCADLHARGGYDTPRGSCRRIYEEQIARDAEHRRQELEYERDQAKWRALQDVGRGLQGNPSTSCTSRVVGDRVYTDCN